MMVIDSKFDIGQTVYLKTDPDQHPRLVTELRVLKTDVLYGITFSDIFYVANDFELTKEKNYANV